MMGSADDYKAMAEHRLDRAHLDALPILLQPLIQCKGGGGNISSGQACRILAEWDKARQVRQRVAV